MSTPASPRIRRDAARNRAAILAAARALFEANGANVAFEDVSRAAGLSRTSLSRHFPDRADLIAALWESDVARIEELAATVGHQPTGVVVVLDHILGQQVDRVALHPLRNQVSGPQLAPLVERVRHAFEALLERAQAGGVARDDVDVDDILTVIDMCASAIVHADAREDRQEIWLRVRRLAFPGLFAVSV
jgi:AcrR family transcriptional regulator